MSIQDIINDSSDLKLKLEFTIKPNFNGFKFNVVLMLIVVKRHIQRYFSYIVTGQMSSFQILTRYRAPTPWAARGLTRAEPTSTRAPGRPNTSFTSLPSEGPHAVWVSGESNFNVVENRIASTLCYCYK